MHKHWLRYGTAAEQKHMIKYKDKYDGIVINASMLAHTAKSISRFIHSEVNNKPYFIDPMTHAFQHDLAKIKNDKNEIKSSIEKLIEEYGNPIKEKIEKGQPVKIDDFNSNNLSDFTLSVLGFQYKHIFASLEDDLKEYVEYMGDYKKPEFLIAPYFYMTKLNSSQWLPLNEKLINKSLEHKDEFSKQIFAQLVIDKSFLMDANLMSIVIDKYSKVDGLIYWIDDFDETTASKEELSVILKFVKDYKMKNPNKTIISLYGGYFSQLLLKYDLSGVVHGLEYGEMRAVIPVGGGIPRSKFYLPALRKRINGSVIAPIVFYESNNAKEFYEKICNCVICKNNIKQDINTKNEVLKSFDEKYLLSKPIEINYKNGSSRATEFPLIESKIQCLYHYLEVKYKEFEKIDKIEISSLLSELINDRDDFEQYFSVDEIAYIDRWVDVLKDD